MDKLLLLAFVLYSLFNLTQANNVETENLKAKDAIVDELNHIENDRFDFDLKFTDGVNWDDIKSDLKDSTADKVQHFRYIRSADQDGNETSDATTNNPAEETTTNNRIEETTTINPEDENTTNNPTDENTTYSQTEATTSNNQTDARDLVLLPWQPWSACISTQCESNGTRQRERRCVMDGETFFDEILCQAVLTENETCSEPCGVERSRNVSRWLSWSEWGQCSVSCGVGYQHRQRLCENPETGFCEGHANDTKLCQVSCVWWGNWTQWTSCSRTCGSEGIQLRRRLCNGQRIFSVIDTEEDGNQVLKRIPQRGLDNNQQAQALTINTSLCPGGEAAALETKPCSVEARCVARWSVWGNWSQCSASCGVGFQQTNRLCLGGSRSACRGNSVKYQRCYSPPCWLAWSQFNKCSRSCGTGGGYQIRSRRCRGTSQGRPEYRNCVGDRTERRRCNAQACPVWGSWGRFGRCSRTCGSGSMTRTRSCVRGNCGEGRISKQSCNNQRCPSWSQWTAFTCCTRTCGNNGFKSRRRKCQYAKRTSECPGSPSERIRCFLQACNANFTSVFDTFQCGYYPRQQTTTSVLRILGGRTSQANRWPWQGSWQHKTCSYCKWVHFCGATLVAPGWAVTASHCIKETNFAVNYNNPGNSWSVVLGMHRLYNDGQRHFLKKIYIHPSYRYTEVTTADIALLKLRRPAQLTSKVNPVCLPPYRLPAAGTSCYVTGWGYTESPRSSRSQLSKVLKEARVPLMSFPACQRLGWIYRTYLNSRNHLCAGDPSTARADSCTGDSGGPLVCEYNDEKWYLSGITSFGFTSCGKRGHAGIYVPVHRYKSWIRSSIDRAERGIC